MDRYRIKDRGSLSALVIEQAWEELRTLIADLPSVVIVLLAAGSRSRKRRLGHFARSTWHYKKEQNAHEVAISPILFDQPGSLLATLLHEAAHAYLFHRQPEGGGGVSADGYYHRKEFRDVCVEFGLEVGFLNTRHGWTLTDWPATGVPEKYQHIVNTLKTIPAGAGGLTPGKLKGRATPEPGLRRLVCQCERPRKIYASKSVSDEGRIVCGFCQKPFLGEQPGVAPQKVRNK